MPAGLFPSRALGEHLSRALLGAASSSCVLACRHITPVSALPLAFCVSVIPSYKDICHWLWATLSPE